MPDIKIDRDITKGNYSLIPQDYKCKNSQKNTGNIKKDYTP